MRHIIFRGGPLDRITRYNVTGWAAFPYQSHEMPEAVTYVNSGQKDKSGLEIWILTQ
jgi:hypothetical protein